MKNCYARKNIGRDLMTIKTENIVIEQQVALGDFAFKAEIAQLQCRTCTKFIGSPYPGIGKIAAHIEMIAQPISYTNPESAPRLIGSKAFLLEIALVITNTPG